MKDDVKQVPENARTDLPILVNLKTVLIKDPWQKHSSQEHKYVLSVLSIDKVPKFGATEHLRNRC